MDPQALANYRAAAERTLRDPGSVGERRRAAHPWSHAIGNGAIAWAIATWGILVLDGMFEGRIHFAARAVMLSLAFGLAAWMHVRRGIVSHVRAAAVFTGTVVALDAIIFGAVDRSLAFLGSFTYWLALALAFATAIIVGAVRARR